MFTGGNGSRWVSENERNWEKLGSIFFALNVMTTLILLSNLPPKIYNNSYKGKTVLIFLTCTAKYKGKMERELSTLAFSAKV